MDSTDEQYKITTSLFNSFRKTILVDIEKSPYKKAAKAIYRQQEKLNSLLQSLLAIEKNENAFYTIQVLTRSAIEHYVLGHYIWTKTRIDKDDKVGDEYYLQYNVSEFFKRENYELRVDGIRLNIPNHNTFNNIIKKFPHFKELKDHELQEVHKRSHQFDIRTMLDYLNNQIEQKDRFLQVHRHLLDALSEYNRLSSYVHGGPSAELETYESIPNTDKILRIKDCITMTKIYTRMMKENLLFLFSEYDIKYLNAIHILLELRKPS